LKSIKKTKSILATGHISAYETVRLVEEAIKRSIKKIVVTHPIYQKIDMSVAMQKKLSAKFKAVVTFALPNGKEAKLPKTFSQTGVVCGVLKKPLVKLMRGYPYRSFFYLPKIKKYYHEDQLDAEEEKEYNHRYKAIQKLIPIISQELIS